MPMTTSVLATTRGTISIGALVPDDSTPAHSLRRRRGLEGTVSRRWGRSGETKLNKG